MSLASRLGDRFKAEFAGRIIATVAGAVLIVLLARLMDPDEYGLLFLAISVFGMVELFSKLGIAHSTARYVAEYKETDSGQIRHILRFGLGLNILTILIVCIGFLIAHEHIADVIGEPELIPLLLAGVGYIALHTLMGFTRRTLQGFEAIKAAASIHVVDRVARLVFAVALVVAGLGAIGALIGYIAAFGVAAALGLGWLFLRYYRGRPPTAVEPGLRRRLAEYTVPLTATSTANVLDKRVDTILVGFFIGPVAVAYYTIGKQVVTFIETPISALGFTITPTLAAETAKGNPESAARIYEESLFHGLALYIPAAAGLVLVAEPTVELVFGSGYVGAVPVVQVLAIYAVAMAITKLTSHGLNYLGRAKERAIAKGLTSVMNVGLNIALIPTIGVVGAALATVITYSLYTLANVYIMNLELDLRIRWLLGRTGWVILIAGLMSGIVFFLAPYITGFVTLFAVVAAGVVIWTVLIVGLGIVEIERIRSALN